MHHAYTDTEKDPHSPLYDKNMWTLMWNTRAFSTSIFRGTFKPEERFLKNLTNWAHSWVSRVMWMIVYTVIYVLFAPSPWFYLLIPFHILTVPIAAVFINWVAHKWGSVNYEMKNTSKNLWPFDFIMLGEAYHNNHHKYLGSANMGHKWYEIDPVYGVILVLHKLRVVRINKQPVSHE
jgi:stearoyl-CoA desaturase (delta-9 desaturase)